MGKIFRVEFQRYASKFHIKYLTHTLNDVYFAEWRFKSSQIYEHLGTFLIGLESRKALLPTILPLHLRNFFFDKWEGQIIDFHLILNS